MFDLNSRKNFDQQLKELELEHEALKRERLKLMERLQLTDEDLAYNLLEGNLPEALKSQVDEERKKLEQALEKARTVTDIKETQKKHQERSLIGQNWLFIR